MPPKLLLDEHIWEGLTDVLAKHGHDVIHINRTPQRGINDERVLELAASQGRVVVTFNVKDFMPLIGQWEAVGREHAGVILSKEIGPSELVRRLERLLASVTAADLYNSARWL